MSHHNQIGRILLIVLLALISWYFWFRHTPELDGVKNATMYRMSAAYLCLKGIMFFFLDGLGWFPLPQ